jgi:general stress protein CsbA
MLFSGFFIAYFGYTSGEWTLLVIAAVLIVVGFLLMTRVHAR